MAWWDSWRELFSDSDGVDLVLPFSVLDDAAGRDIERLMGLTGFWDDEKPWSVVWRNLGMTAVPDLAARTVTFRPSPDALGEADDQRVSSEPRLREGVASSEPSWELYFKWNTAVRDRFYDGKWAHRPVYLDMDDGDLGPIAEGAGWAGDPRGGLVAAVAPTLHLEADGISVFRDHTQNLRAWREGPAGHRDDAVHTPEGTPPFLAVLALLCRAAEEMRAGDEYRPNNYLGRLCDLVGIDRGARKQRSRFEQQFRAETPAFWQALNEWLEAQSGYLGTPTARVWDWRVYVGLPISQVIMKKSDRMRLPAFFTTMGLQAGRRFAPADLKRLLADWLPNAPVSPFLKELWGRGDTDRSRIAEVVGTELESWDGTIPDGLAGSSITSGRLRLWAMLRRHPTLRVGVGLTAWATVDMPEGEYRLTEAATEQAKNALGPPGALAFRGFEAGVGAPAEDITYLSVPDLLLTTVEIAHASGFTLMREPRGVIVLDHSEAVGVYVEVERAELDAEALVLAHATFADEVKEILDQHARPGFRREEIGGVPRDWALFTGVQMHSAPPTSRNELACLVPLARSSVAFGGGLRLPDPRTWHTASPPELRATLLDHDVGTMSISCTQVIDADLPRLDSIELGTVGGAGTVNVGALGPGLVDGDYSVEIVEASDGRQSRTIIASDRFRLRSGSWPRVLHKDELLGGHVVDGHGRPHPVTASRVLDGAVFATGAVFKSDVSEPTVAALPPLNLTARRGGELDDDLGPTQHTSPRGQVASCAISGAHHWLLPTAGRSGMPKWFNGTCRNCGITQGFPRWPGRRRTSPTSAAPEQRGDMVPVLPVSAQVGIDHDLLLDALTYVGAGAWPALRALTEQVSDEPWASAEISRTLAALGHIDLELGGEGLRPQRWGIAPSTLAVLRDGTALLCGARSHRLMGALDEACDALGGDLVVEAQGSAPDRVTIANVGPEGFEQISLLLASRGLEVDVVIRPDRAYATALVPIAEAAAGLKVVHMPLDVATKRYDWTDGRWTQHEGVLSPGAYQMLTRPVRYGVMLPGSEPGMVIAADNRWSKWIAAAALGHALLAYDADARQLVCPLGAQLPGIYERAVVLCSGWAPLPMRDGTVVYRDVPPSIASLVWEAVGGAASGAAS